MNRTRFIYQVLSEVEFSREDVEHLIDLSRQHYDHKVRSLSSVGGLLFGMRNQCMFGGPRTVQLSTRELDTLCKAVEGTGADYALRGKLRDLLSEAQEKYRELNP